MLQDVSYEVPERIRDVGERFAGLDGAVSAAKLLGYLNFSDGRPEPRWQKLLNEAYAFLDTHGESRPHRALYEWLVAQLSSLQTNQVAGFKKVDQVSKVLDIVFNQVLPAYQQYHADLLFHLSERDLFQPLFLARVCE